MAYAVVSFCDDELVSEVPTNWLQEDGSNYLCWWPPAIMKNVPSLISKRINPDIQTWQLLPVTVEKYCPSVEKARKIAEDKNYTSCEESQLGKGFRTKIPNKQIYSDCDSEEDKEDKNKKAKIKKVIRKNSNRSVHKESSDSDNNNNKTQEIEKKRKPELPQWPDTDNRQVDETESFSQSLILSTFNETNDDEFGRNYYRKNALEQSPISSSKIHINQSENIVHKMQQIKEEMYKMKQEMRKIKEEMCKLRDNIMTTVLKREENIQTLNRMVAASDIRLINIQQSIDNITPGVLPIISTDRVTKYLPLKTINEILQMEEKLKNEGEIFINEYKTFVRRIGGHTAREIIRNTMSQVFTNECALPCSWKGRKENFGVASLCIIKHMRKVVLDMYTNYTQKEFDEAASDWLRFAKQRFTREIRQRETNE